MLLIASCDDILKSTSSSSFRMRRVALRDIRRLQRVSPEHPQSTPMGTLYSNITYGYLGRGNRSYILRTNLCPHSWHCIDIPIRRCWCRP